MENIEDFRLSWEKSMTETRRLITYFRSLTPHHVRSTLNLNETRALIMYLTKPMIDIMQQIDTTIQSTVETIEELNIMKLERDRLQNRLHQEKSELGPHSLDEPRLVCNDVACKEYRDDGTGTLKALLCKNTSDIQLKEAAIKSLENKVAVARYEHKEIQKAAARFGLFLKKNSITPYNDVVLVYLDHLIKKETARMVAGGRGSRLLDSLQRNRREHLQNVDILSKNMTKGLTEELLDEARVEDPVDHLYRLKHWGKNLREMKDQVEATHLSCYREKPYRPRNHGRSFSSNLRSSVQSNSINSSAGRVNT